MGERETIAYKLETGINNIVKQVKKVKDRPVKQCHEIVTKICEESEINEFHVRTIMDWHERNRFPMPAFIDK